MSQPVLSLLHLGDGLSATINLSTEQMLLGQPVSRGQERWHLTVALVSYTAEWGHGSLEVLKLTGSHWCAPDLPVEDFPSMADAALHQKLPCSM